MVEEQNDVIAKIDSGKVMQSGQDAAASAAIAVGEAAINSGNIGDLQIAQQTLATAAPSSTAAAMVAANVDAAINNAQQQATQTTITSSIPDMISAAVQNGIITSGQAEQISQMVASQTIIVPAAESVQLTKADNLVPQPADTYAKQVEQGRAKAIVAARIPA